MAVVVGLVLAIAVSSALAANRTYVNPRFGTTITFPDAIFTQLERDQSDGDGSTWSAPDGATLRVWGQNNTQDLTPSEIADLVAQGFDTVNYRKIGSKWMVISGLDNGALFYHRAELGARGVIHSFEMRYSENTRAHYDRLASMIAESLIGP